VRRLTVDRQLTPSEAEDLEACFRTHYWALRAYACVLTRNDLALAEDLVQDAFHSAASAWPTLGPLSELARLAWLRATVHNIAVTSFRHNEMTRRKAATVEEYYRPLEPDTSRDALNALDVDLCWRVITEMPRRQHLISVMYWYMGMKQSEIAEKLGIAPGTVAAHLHGARSKLRTALPERHPPCRGPGDDVGLASDPEEGGAEI
jgi:RNA polymerase sigma factor (sigma-70 family)